MKTRDTIFKEILADQAVTDAVLAMSKSFKEGDWSVSFAPYFRVCGALADCLNRMEIQKHGPGEEGLLTLVPYVALGMPGFNQGFTSHWCDAYLGATDGTPEIFFEEAAFEARVKGEAGEPNYVHGLLMLDGVGDMIVQIAGMSLLVATAENLRESELLEAGDMKVH